MNIYKYIYYRLYTWNLKKWGANDIPEYNAMLGVSFLMGLNIGIVPAILNIVFHFDRYIDAIVGKVILCCLMAPLLIFNYIYLMYKKKYLKIVSQYKNEDASARRKHTFLIWGFTVLTFLILIILAKVDRIK